MQSARKPLRTVRVWFCRSIGLSINGKIDAVQNVIEHVRIIWPKASVPAVGRTLDLIADTNENLQQLTDRVDGSSRRMGLRINTGKTMTIGKRHEDIQIKLGGEVLEQVTKFVYLGGTLTEDGRCTEDIRRRIGLACAAFGKMWRTQSISLKTKMKLYWALVLPVLMDRHAGH